MELIELNRLYKTKKPNANGIYNTYLAHAFGKDYESKEEKVIMRKINDNVPFMLINKSSFFELFELIK